MDNKIKYTEKNIMDLADNMAAAAAMFNAHGYDTFISAREELKKALRETINKETFSDRGPK